MKNSNLSPLCVDLDGTLIATDSLWESILVLLRQNFWLSFLLPIWLLKGKAYFKYKISQYSDLDIATLPYNEQVLDFLNLSKNRKLVLATAANQKIAHAVADHLQIFDEVIASDEQINMIGVNKRDALKDKFGTYSYIGDSSADIPILKAAQEAYLVSPSHSLLTQCPAKKIFATPKPTLKTWIKSLRPHQWVKNTLIFLPLILAHQILDISKLADAMLAFLAFSLIASSGYVINDLLDLAADRTHPTKKNRPFASGKLPIKFGLPIFVILVSLGFFISLLWLNLNFTGMLALYLALTLAYSFYLKKKLVVDVIVLAGLYTHRILAGGLAVSVEVSSWLLAFSMFMFMSLALLKRYVELHHLTSKKKVKNRGYEIGDICMIASMGPTSGYLAVLVFSLYISSDKVTTLYSSPFILWLTCPVLLYWITRIWFLANRKQMLDDPVQFALTDKISWLVVVCTGILISLATVI
ncbi:UbiA family prenyltransferase [Candidatus Halobeggiatoa sp. HSG11]|nr:UbiA family prenyltransferase [Candidatus Halobeggiatoa sp. HSG11]